MSMHPSPRGKDNLKEKGNFLLNDAVRTYLHLRDAQKRNSGETVSDLSAKITSIEQDATPKRDEGSPISKSTAPLMLESTVEDEPVKTRNIWIIGSIMALIWICIVGSVYYLVFVLGTNDTRLASWPMLAHGIIAFLPAALILMFCYLMTRFSRLSAQTRSVIDAADRITRPDETAQARATHLASAVRSQIISVDSELAAALDRLAGMENVLRGHVSALTDSHVTATQQTHNISDQLTEQRTALKTLTGSFDERMASLSHMLTEHNERLSSSTHVAEQKIQEARVSVEGAAAKINASSEIVRDNAMSASKTLDESHTKIAKLGDDIRAQSETLGELNSRHADDMKSLLEQLRQEQQELEASIEERLSRLREMSLSAKVSTESLNDASEAGRQTVEALAKSATLADSAVKERFAEMEEMVRYSNSRAESISDRAAKRVRDSLALTRMEIGRIEDDMHALESRMSRSADQPEELVVEPRSSWRKNLLRFRPLTGQSPIVDVDVDAETEDATNVPHLSLNEPEPTVEDLVLTSEEPPQITPEPSPEPLLLDIPQPETEPQVTQDLSLDVQDQPMLSMPELKDDVLSPVLETTLPQTLRKKQGKSGWSWRGFLGGIDEEVTPQSTPIKSTSKMSLDERKADIIARLKAVSLAPNSVVDEGCVIEAVNTRKFKGAADMREVISLRLPAEITHLRSAFSTDPDLKAAADDFAQRFYQVLGAVSSDRESLRETMQTEAGRAFILCDTALG